MASWPRCRAGRPSSKLSTARLGGAAGAGDPRRNSTRSTSFSRAMRAAPRAGLHGQSRCRVPLQPQFAAAIDHGFHEQEEIGGPAAGQGGDGVQRPLGIDPAVMPTAESICACVRCCSLKPARLAYSPLAPQRSRAGVLGMQRTMAVSAPSRPCMLAMVIPAAMEMTRAVGCSRTAPAMLSAAASAMTWGLTARMTTSAPARPAALSS